MALSVSMREIFFDGAWGTKERVRTLAQDRMGHLSETPLTAEAGLSEPCAVISCMPLQWCLPVARQHAGVWTMKEAAVRGAIADKAITAVIVMDKRRCMLSNARHYTFTVYKSKHGASYCPTFASHFLRFAYLLTQITVFSSRATAGPCSLFP